jgi:predicted Zn-dependent protease
MWKVDMRRRIYFAAVILISFASVAVATFVAVQKAKPTPKPTAQKSSTTPAGQKAGATKGAATPPATNAPIRPVDANRAPQNLVDEALYTNEDFFGVSASVARPYAVALERVNALEGQFPKDARLKLHSARLAERTGQFDKAATEMNQYAELKRRSPDALRRLSNFYHNRARYSDEVKTLRELAKALPINERAPIYKTAAGLVRSYALKEFKPADFFAELVAADSSNIQPVKDYVEELHLAKQNQEALATLTSFQAKFPNELGYFLKTRAEILEENNDRRAAEEVYSSAFDPNWSRKIAADYYDLLRRFGRYRIARRTLQDRVKAGATDLQTVGRLFSFFAYESNYEQASQLLRQMEERRAGRKAGTTTNANPSTPQPVRASDWNAGEIETVAAMYASIGNFDQASRYLYTLYLMGKLQASSSSRENALYRLFKVMIDAAGTPTRVGTGDLSFYEDVAEVDQHPGFMNGVLSLILSGTDPKTEFATEEKAAAGFFNRAFAYRIFTSFKQEFAQSKYLGEMYLGVVNVFAGLGEHKLAIAAGREFQTLFPDSSSYVDVTLRMADSYVALQDRSNERALILPLLDRLAKTRPKGTPLVASSSKRWAYTISPGFDAMFDKIKYDLEAYSDTYEPTDDKSVSEEGEEGGDEEEGDGSASVTTDKQAVTYSSVLERYVSSLATDDKQQETVGFFWGEIRKHPKEEGLYERFLRWLGQAQIINEQLKAYNSAIRQFDSNTWYHRLARWYVRQKRGKELTTYSRKLIDVFDEEEITDYLYRFAGYGTTAVGDTLDWDQKLAFDLYDYSHKKFPRNLFFVRGMLTYLANAKEYAQWEKLSAQYYFADRSIREPYLARLSQQNQLRGKYETAKQQTKAAAQGSSSTAPNAIFAADAALWLSHHDEALTSYRELTKLYPGETQYGDRLADLTRSFGQTSDKLYEESAGTLEKMAEIYPTNHEYRIKSGEVYAQLGDFKRAGEQWDKLIKQEPGERETYLEIATVYWDYYQYDQALRVFRDLRQTTGDANIYAYRMGAVYEGKGQMDSAIAEYVKVLNEPGDGRDTVAKRLAQLARRKGLDEKIAAEYRRASSANQKDWQLIIGYASYLAEREQVADALAMLRTEVARSTDVAFLETVRDLFRQILRPEDEQQVLGRLATVARDEREAMTYRLQLAAFLERKNQVDAALGVIDKLVADYPTNVGVVEESAKFYWRAGLVDRSLDLYKRTLAKAEGANRRTITLQLARRQFEANRLDDAEKTLRTFYEENRTDTEVFGELAKTLGAANKLNELTELYKSGLKDVREAGGENSKEQVAELRLGMVKTLDALGKFEDAVDQHIEIINAFPEDENRLAAAIGYAEKHNLVERLTTYYEKLTKTAFKNYRWQLVLGRMYERFGNIAGASEQYRNAVTNEPQRTDLRFSLASTLARQKRYDEAIAVLREGWTLSGRESSWLIEVARLQIAQGKRNDAVATIRQALAAKKNVKTEDEFAMASKLASWGIHAEAVKLYEATFARLPKVLKDEYVGSDVVRDYTRALLKTDSTPTVYQKLQRLRAQYEAIGANSKDADSYRAKNVVNAVDAALRADFGIGVLDYATGQETAALAAALQTETAKLILYTDRETLLRYAGIAHAAGLVEVEEQLLTRIKDAAFKARVKPEDTKCYNELRALVSFYNRRAAFAKSAEILTAEFARDKYKERFDYQNQIAMQYRLAGDRDRELASLRASYAAASGALSESNADWVERYLSLLYEANMKDELQRVATSTNPYQIQLINFFIEKNEINLARTAIANAKQSPAWAASRSGEVGLFLKDNSAATENFFKSALDIQPIGQMLGRKVDTNQTLVGDDWFVAARNYGYWLNNAGRDGRRLTSAEIEGDPKSASAQLEQAAFSLERKDAKQALSHVALAAELSPGDADVAVMRGSVLLAQGDKKGALDAWNAMMSGRVTIDGAQAYLKVMANNGLLREALPQLEGFIVAYANRPKRKSEYESRAEQLAPLVRAIAERGDAKNVGAIASSFESILNRLPENVGIGRLIVDENLLPENAMTGIFRAMHRRFVELANATFGTPEYDGDYFTGEETVNPARDLSEFRHRFLDYLIRANSLAEARLLVTEIKKDQAEIALAYEDQAGDDDSESAPTDYYEWLPLASALIELRSGSEASKAVAELRRYCGLEGDAKDSSSTSEESTEENYSQDGMHERCLKAYALLLTERKDAEAEALLYDVYKKDSQLRYASDASLAGLAEIEARRGRSNEASRLLKLLVERSTDNLQALRLAAETAAKMNRLADATDFREQIARANPDDATNKLELVRLIATDGRNAVAMDRAIALLTERTTPNSVKAQLAEVVGEIAKRDRTAAEKIQTLFQGTGLQDSAGALLADAAFAESTGNLERAQAQLSKVKGPLESIAQAKLGLINRNGNKDAEAAKNFERAIYLDPDEMLTDAIAFRLSSSRVQLINLYSKLHRDHAAIRLTEGEPDMKSPLSAAARQALNSSGETTEKATTAVFEPSLEITASKITGLKTYAELNQAASASAQSDLIFALAESSARLGRLDRAIALERLRASVTKRVEEKTAIEKRIESFVATKLAREKNAAALLRISKAMGNQAIYSSRVLGN